MGDELGRAPHEAIHLDGLDGLDHSIHVGVVTPRLHVEKDAGCRECRLLVPCQLLTPRIDHDLSGIVVILLADFKIGDHGAESSVKHLAAECAEVPVSEKHMFL